MAVVFIDLMTAEILALLMDCIAKDDMLPFYRLKEWKYIRTQVLLLDKKECQICKRRGIYDGANTVHHVNHLKDRPELGLSIWFVDSDGKTKRNLIAVSTACHEIEHGHRHTEAAPPLTPERW